MKALLSLAALALASSLSFAADSKIIAGTYDIDASHSKVGFEIPRMVISTVDGQFTKFEGKITLADKIEKSKVSVTIDAASIDTGNKKRDDHLRNADFFDASKYPQIKFESTEVKGTAESFKVTGNLTMHGVTKKVTLDGKMLGSVNDGYGNDRAAFSASGDRTAKTRPDLEQIH